MTAITAEMELLTQAQVCARLGISDETWRRWRRAHRTPSPVQLPSGRLKWRCEDIDRLIGEPGAPHRARRFFQSGARQVEGHSQGSSRNARGIARASQ